MQITTHPLRPMAGRDPGQSHRVVAAKLDKVPHGTGDFLSGLYLAERLSQPPHRAFTAAMETLTRAIWRSAGSSVLDVAGALHGS